MAKLIDKDLKSLVVERENLNERLAILRAEMATVINAIDHHIDKGVADARKTQRKDTGIVNVEIEDVAVKHDIPKRVVWDQKKLDALHAKILQHEDPGKYIDITYGVSEKKFNTFPDAVKKVFAPARTVKAGKPKISFTIIPNPAEALAKSLPYSDIDDDDIPF